MSSPNFTSPTPQFGTAEFQGGPDRCQLCGETLGSTYYRVGPKQSCPACAEKAKFETPKDTHAAFVRGVLFGCGGALLGLIAYSTFGIMTGLVIGYLSLLVGYIIGKAIMMGSRGIGGRRYQIAALLLTYAAVSVSAVPIGISMYIKERDAKRNTLVQHSLPGKIQQPPAAQSPEASSQEAVDDNDSKPGASAAASSSSKPAAAKMSFAAAIGAFLFAGLASPFLALQDPFHGVIGLIILAVGIRIAWRLTAGVSTEILGPFPRTPPPPPSAG
jgi:predicted lipid-binding transport protein (Tim44 family)